MRGQDQQAAAGRLSIRAACVVGAIAAVALAWPAVSRGATAPVGDPGREQLSAMGAPLAAKLSTSFAGRASLDGTMRAGATSGWTRGRNLQGGGVITTATGRTITMLWSPYYTYTASLGQSRADWWDRILYSNTEFSRLTVAFAPVWEVMAICGGGIGCYSPAAQLMLVPGSDPESVAFLATYGLRPEAVWFHEYGHHVGANRDNAPWAAIDTGTKRWSSYANVCQKVATGAAAIGDPERYWSDPGEAFAEAYALAVHARWRWPDAWAPWAWEYDAIFTPDPAAFQAIADDVARPWAAVTGSEWAGSFAPLKPPAPKAKPKPKPKPKPKAAPKAKPKPKPKPRPKAKPRRPAGSAQSPRTQSYRWSTPFDGTLTATVLGAPAGATVTLYDAAGTTALSTPGQNPITFQVCGQREFRLVVSSTATGAFKVSLSTP